ncbi:type II toxin-antitoxin system VapB family antitoxin [Aureimonas mangrovi]|uniref:type II toxin-antitoxin system VapB family antitoxin n=1 Tax=Aureimonas mangrovi TaxID=2758041 RepID=UPI00163D4469|nr:type II toxin-antitoxin system VapB family antitoxin [Aureimonas mangrovi]
MPLYVKDQEVGELATRLATIKGTSKTDAVRVALKHELERAKPSYDAKLAELRRIQADLRAKAKPGGLPTTKEWIDSLYEDD